MPMGKQKINIYSLKDYTHLCLCIKKQYKIYVVICLIFFIITFFFFHVITTEQFPSFT